MPHFKMAGELWFGIPFCLKLGYKTTHFRFPDVAFK